MHDAISAIADEVRSAATSTEGTFVETGQRLGASAATLEDLTALFGTLQSALESDTLHAATASLSSVAGKAADLAGARRDERSALDRLSAVSATLRRRIDDIAREVRTIDVLAINGRITASGIGGAGEEFLDYIGEIGRSLKITEANLRHFRDDLVQVGHHVDIACAGEAAFDARHAETVVVVPRQLSRSVETIAGRCRAAAGAAAGVGVRSQEVAQEIGRVVMALQTGDAARQRMEHVETAAAMLVAILSGERADGPWAALPAPERAALATAGCALLAAQLADTADELEREIASVHGVLGRLAVDAEEIVRLGQDVFGASAHGGGSGGSFLQELEEDVRRARELFEGFHDARSRADEVMAEVLRISGRLVEHIGTVRAVEADIRIMGVNATLKSSRLGSVGRPLAVIAEELTLSSSRTGAEAAAATGDVETITTTASTLAGQNQTQRLAEIAAVTTSMDEAIGRLHEVAQTQVSALAALAQDGTTVVRVLTETTAGLAAAETIASTIRYAAARFSEQVAAAKAAGTAAPDPNHPATVGLYAEIAALYTMARERTVHAAHAPRTAAPPTAPAAAGSSGAAETSADAALDDIFF